MAVLESEFVRLVAVPEVGARVVSLVDRRTGREWLVQGTLPADDVAGSASARARAAEDAVFGGDEAFGWDECLPTVAPCADPLDPAAPPLRDHGDQWGRPAEVAGIGGGLRATWTGSRWPYVLRRTISLEGATVIADYEVEVRGDRPLPILWSMHALIALEPGSNIIVEPAARARLTHHAGLGLASDTQSLDWPGSSLDVVRGIEAGQAAKLYVAAAPLTTVAARTVDGAELRFSWDRAVAPALGIWLSYGGWPVEGRPRHQVALEPTTSPDDDLASAIAAGRAMVVAPGSPRRWTVRIALVAGS
ncbi:MAG TPA: hypothetical protein VFO73_06680 [Candidatus Limnocylindrales bacterium]|nr:hypothetical protein [Candidatus Limnocylindrales bacterium]